MVRNSHGLSRGLFEKAIAGDPVAITELGIAANTVDEEGETILHSESWKGNTERVRFILNMFPNKNLLVKLNRSEQTALHLAVDRGNSDVVEVLIDAAKSSLPCSANDETDTLVGPFHVFFRQPSGQSGNTALHIAVLNDNVKIVKLLLQADPDDRHIPNHEGKTPIYIAAENGLKDVVKEICTICTALSLAGPDGRTTALHAIIQNLQQVTEGASEMIRMIIHAAKRWSNADFEAFFLQTDELGSTVLQLAVEKNCADAVRVILLEDPAYQHGREIKRNGLMHLIYKAIDNKYSDDIVQLLSQTYQVGISTHHKDVLKLILAIKSGDEESVLRLLSGAKDLVTFREDDGWTALHYAVYHEFDSILGAIIGAQEDVGHQFVYENMVPTPLHLARVKCGYTSTLVRLMQLWPTSSSAVDKNGKNILHIAAMQSEKKMIQDILRYCPQEYKDELVNKPDNNGNTPLHLLIERGCLVPELLKYEGLDTRVENNNRWTPPDMLYVEDQIIDDQVKIRVALDHIQIDQNRDIFTSSVFSASKRERKNEKFREQAQRMIVGKLALMKEDARAFANCLADAIAGDPISRAAVEMEADALNGAGETILHVESKKGVIENVRFIVSAFANKNLLVRLDHQKQTALYLAAHHGHTQVVEALLDAARRNLPFTSANDDTHNPVTAFPDYIRQATDPMRNTALHIAVINCHVAVVKLLVQANPNDNHVENCDGKTPIYIAAEKGYTDIVKQICMTCTSLSLDGPGGWTTALHALLQNIGQVTEGASDMIRMIIHAAKRWSNADFEALFCRVDEFGSTVLQLAVEKNCVDAVRLILQEDPAYQHGREIKRNGLMRLIYRAIDNKCSDDIIKLLCQTYEAGIINPDHKHVVSFILATKRRDKDSVLGLLLGARDLVTFTEDNGWTPLHYAVYHEFDSVIGAIIEAQEDVGHQFVYENLVPTPFHVAVECGYSSTLVRLMQSWPALSSASRADNSPFTVVNRDGRNILHLAAEDNGNIQADNRKEMVEGILKYCPREYKNKILEQQDINGDTPLHLLIFCGCFVEELMIKDEGVDTLVKNKKNFTPRDMLYLQNDVVADQVQIKIAIDDITTGKFGPKIRNKNIFRSSGSVPPSKLRIKDVIFDQQKKILMDEKHAKMKLLIDAKMKEDLQRYRQGTNTQIVVSALITTITFTVGFTMPGGLHQSGEVNEGLTILTKKAAFNAFMIFDAIALLLSSCSLLIYFLDSMSQNLRQLTQLYAITIVLNIISVMMMMLVFMTGTYVVLSHSLALAITICVISSLFFVYVVIQLRGVVYDRRVQKNQDHKHEA